MRIEELWQMYVTAVQAPPEAHQALKQAFYGGCVSLFEMIRFASDDTESEREAMQFFFAIDEELKAFVGGTAVALPPSPPLESYDAGPRVDVYSWSPSANNEMPPTQVHLVVAGESGQSVIRMKSARVVEELAAALLEHRNFVWPEAKSDS